MDWCFNKHPPASAFFSEIFFQIFGSQDWAFYLLSQIFILISFFYVFKFANEIFNLLLVGLFLIVLVIQIFMPIFVGLIAPGFVEDDNKMSLAVNLTRITFPFLMFVSLSSFFSAILNSHNKFAAASAAPIILNILLIVVLFFGKILNDKCVIACGQNALQPITLKKEGKGLVTLAEFLKGNKVTAGTLL